MIINSTKVSIPLAVLQDDTVTNETKIVYFKILSCKEKVRQNTIPIEILQVDTSVPSLEYHLRGLQEKGYLEVIGGVVHVFDFKEVFQKRSYPGFFYFGEYSNGDMKIGISKKLKSRYRQLRNQSPGFKIRRAIYFSDFGAAMYCENKVKRLIKDSGFGIVGTSESFKADFLVPISNLFNGLTENLEHEEVEGYEWWKNVGYL